MRLPWGVISILFPFHGVCRPFPNPSRTALIAYGKCIAETPQGCSPQIDVKSMNEVNGPLVRLSEGAMEGKWRSIIEGRNISYTLDNTPVNYLVPRIESIDPCTVRRATSPQLSRQFSRRVSLQRGHLSKKLAGSKEVARNDVNKILIKKFCIVRNLFGRGIEIDLISILSNLLMISRCSFKLKWSLSDFSADGKSISLRQVINT